MLTSEGKEWIQADSNEIYTQNPLYLKHLSDENKIRISKHKKLREKEEVAILPDQVGQ